MVRANALKLRVCEEFENVVWIGCRSESFVFDSLAGFGFGVLAEEADCEAAEEREVGCAVAVSELVIVFAELTGIINADRARPSGGGFRWTSGCVGRGAVSWNGTAGC